MNFVDKDGPLKCTIIPVHPWNSLGRTEQKVKQYFDKAMQGWISDMRE